MSGCRSGLVRGRVQGLVCGIPTVRVSIRVAVEAKAWVRLRVKTTRVRRTQKVGQWGDGEGHDPHDTRSHATEDNE